MLPGAKALALDVIDILDDYSIGMWLYLVCKGYCLDRQANKPWLIVYTFV